MPNNLSQYINKESAETPIKENDTFKFTCAKECWGTCCIEENVTLLQLSVYDVYILLSQRTDSSIIDLIEIKVDERINLPRAFMKWKENGWCPNLMEDGSCKVYMDRPFVCRIFPLSSNFMINDSTGIITPNYKLRENFCYGFHKEANPKEQILKDFLNTDDFHNREDFVKLEVSKRQEWIKKYDLKKLTDKQLLNLSQVLFCLREKIAGKKDYFFDYFSEMLKIPKRSKRLEIFTPVELAQIALEEFAPRLLEKFKI